MRCIIGTQSLFRRKNGQVVANVKTYDRLWRRYLDVFDSITLIGRVADAEEPDWEPVEGPGVSLVQLPGFRALTSLLRSYLPIRHAIRSACSNEAAYILRLPGIISDLIWWELRGRGHPYAVEVAGDPRDAYGRGYNHPLQPLFQWWATWHVRTECAGACAAGYRSQVQGQDYPAGDDALVAYYPDVVLPEEKILDQPRPPRASGEISLISIGSLQQLYKAPDVALESLAECVDRGLDVTMTWLGGGRCREDLQKQAQELGLEDRANFIGHVPAEKVTDYLDDADLYLHPSRAEGMPKALLEAMARGLPAIGSTVGGIPELLAEEDLVPPGDVRALAEKICEVVRDPERMKGMSARNLQTAWEYRDEAMDERRASVYQHLQEATEAWLKEDRQGL